MAENIKVDEKPVKWKGIDRTAIEWNPKINLDKCVGCGMCVTSCGKGVFGYDVKSRKATVEHPYNCMVGCTSCEVWCVFGAISFPDKRYVQDLIKNKGVLSVAKKDLEQKFQQ